MLLTKVSAILITRKLDNILIGDSTLRVCLIHNQDDYPELTFAQEEYISSMFQDAYSRFKSQIMRNIKNKLLNVTDFTNYKTHKCNGTCRGDKTNCNFYHNLSDRRRNPLRCPYLQKMCTSPGVCTQGDLCSSAHNIYEQMFYPTNFQTILCPLHDKNTPITNGFCKFAHKDSPELFFTGSWQDIVTFGTQNSLRFLAGAIRAIHKLTFRKDVKICFITQSEEFLEVAFKMIDDFAFQYKLKCVNLEKSRYNKNAYDVYFGKPSTVNNYSGKILSIHDYGVLIVDNIKAVMEDSQDAEHLLKICQRLKISAGIQSPINKVFVSSSYDREVTGVVSSFLGIPLQELIDSDIHPEPKLTTKTQEESKSYSDESGKDIMVISSRSRSRSHSRSRTSRSRRSVSKSHSRRSSSRSRRKRSRSLKRWSRSRSRRRSRSRSRSLSRSRKRKSKSRSITRSRRRSSSRSRRSRSESKTRKMSSSKSRKSPSKSHRKQSETHRSKSPKSTKSKKRQTSPKNPPQISKKSKLDELLANQPQISQKPEMDYFSTKLSENVFSPHGTFQSSSKISLEVEKNVPRCLSSLKTYSTLQVSDIESVLYLGFFGKGKIIVLSPVEDHTKSLSM
ncbi:hypothetical protein Avbf_04758 [Armadillidium vulgare]|nr:hypothetical protein Avbf_04758 [Armadillidium vulgare]